MFDIHDIVEWFTESRITLDSGETKKRNVTININIPNIRGPTISISKLNVAGRSESSVVTKTKSKKMISTSSSSIRVRLQLKSIMLGTH